MTGLLRITGVGNSGIVEDNYVKTETAKEQLHEKEARIIRQHPCEAEADQGWIEGTNAQAGVKGSTDS